jgi:hypothetical protein
VPTRTEPGVYVGMSYTEYAAIDAINWSTLRHIRRSPAHMLEEQVHPSAPTAELDFGNAFHCAVLEPERFVKEYAPAPDGVGRRSKDDKTKWAEVEKLNPRATILKAGDWNTVTAMRDAVFAHPTASSFLKGPGKNEVVVVWKDPEFGCLCKSRIDALREWQGWTFLVDLKSCQNAAEFAFGQDAAKYRYHEQAGFYLRGTKALDARERRFVFIAVEKERPFGVCCYEMEMESDAATEHNVRRALAKYVECVANKTWPGYMPGIHPLRLPAWATATIGDE